MIKNISINQASRRKALAGWTVLETSIASFCGSIVLGSILVTGNMMNNTMAAVSNYNDLDQCSRNTLDVMSRDLRNTAIVTVLTEKEVRVTNTITGDTIQYLWDGTNALTRNVNGNRTVMLTGCDTLIFQGFQRNPTNNLQFLPTSTAAKTKLISVSWRCSRKILGAKLNTESIQTAQICIRN